MLLPRWLAADRPSTGVSVRRPPRSSARPLARWPARPPARLPAAQDMQAPKENTVEVVALRDCGRLMTTTGHRDVRVNEVHIMRKTDAEPLIRQGWMRHITDKS